MAYSHAPLQDTNSIRLLHLESGCDSTPLIAHLASHRLEDHSSYDALSYVWGEPDLTKSLLIDGQELHISKNLHDILLQLRCSDRNRVLWIDAICINQNDDNEKGQQVAMMGQIYQQAENVLCWLGELSTHRLWALKYFQGLADDAPRYLKPDQVAHMWIILEDELLPGVDVNPVVEDATEAHVEAIYTSDWFTRLWVVQELALARNPKILCGAYEMRWEDFELATRVLASCIRKISPSPKQLRSIDKAWSVICLRGRYCLNMRSVDSKPITLQIDQPWSVGRIAWDMRDKKCKDDKDRVYALLSLTASGNGLGVFVPDAFMPDYTRPVEWAYRQFWRRFGGYSSLFYAGLSRRRGHGKTNTNEIDNEDVSVYFRDDHLPSWVPDLRPRHTKEWKPIFSSDYATSTPFQHMGANFKNGPGMLMLRGHRFDVVKRGFHINQHIEPCQKLEDFVNLRATFKFYLSLESQYAPYPSQQTWIEALGSALMTDMPYEHDHPFQRYLNTFQLRTILSDSELQRIWKLYQDLLLADTGDVWITFRSTVLARKVLRFDPFTELSHDGQLVWLLHKYLGDVLQAHRLIITDRGYMGLAPPETAVDDVVVAIGGPSVPFVVRDVSAFAFAKLVADETNGMMVPDESGKILSRLLGPCYVQGIMRQELFKEERYKARFEWETDKLGTIPKPTLCLI